MDDLYASLVLVGAFVLFVLALLGFELGGLRRRWPTVSEHVNRFAKGSTKRRWGIMTVFLAISAGFSVLGIHLAFMDVLPGI